MEDNRKLKIKFAGRLIDLLGQQMYGGAVPSVAELIANAWDADSKKVEVFLPDDVKEKDAEIIVRDYGCGMSFDELNNYYLHIGYERRKRGDKTLKGRNVMGRKGIGKLAGFGIAEKIVVTSINKGHLVELVLNYTELRNLDSAKDFIFNPIRDIPTSEPDGVIITFKELKLQRSINPDSFRLSMARRFALGSEEMSIYVNKISITKEDLNLEFRYPETEWAEEEIPNFGKVKFWFGFLKNTIQDTELRGVSVFARERVAQFTPFVFNLTGGIDGQVALEYLTGQVKAETLDEETDYIATDRQSVNWQFEKAPLLEDWGKRKIKELCAEWKRKHQAKNVERFQHKLSTYFLRIQNLSSEQEKKDLISALTKVASIERITEDDFKVIANSMISGVERESVKKVIQKINTTSDEALPELFEAIKEWDLLSAVMTAESVAGKISIIEKFNHLIDLRTKEKATGEAIDMQKFLKSYPWLLGPEYESFRPDDFYHERGVDSWIEEIFSTVDTEFKEVKEKRRFDLVVIKNPWRIIVLELMRPNIAADIDHVNRLITYVTRIEDAVRSKGTEERFQKVTVYGLLIADFFAKSPALMKFIQNNRNIIDAIEWHALFESVEGRYQDFFKILKSKAPDDPRLNFLEKPTEKQLETLSIKSDNIPDTQIING
jgi:hypothetical protein